MTETLFYQDDINWPYLTVVWTVLDGEYEYRIELEDHLMMLIHNSQWSGEDYEFVAMPMNWDLSWICLSTKSQ